MSNQKPRRPRINPNSLPKSNQEEHITEDFDEIGGSPFPGLTLLHILRGHEAHIGRIAWSPDGSFLASPSDDKTVRLWDMRDASNSLVLPNGPYAASHVAWSPDGNTIAAGDREGTIRLWNVHEGTIIRTLCGHHSWINNVTFSPDGTKLFSTSGDQTVRVWDVVTSSELLSIKYTSITANLILTKNGQDLLISVLGSTTNNPGFIEVLDWINYESKGVFEFGRKHLLTSEISEDNLAVSFENNTLEIWDLNGGKIKRQLEGHVGSVDGLSFSHDGQILITKGNDNTVNFWKCDSWDLLATLSEESGDTFPTYPRFHPTLPLLATFYDRGNAIRVWSLDYNVLLNKTPETKSIHYTTAKLVLVGDSGVGKTGLGWRLAHNEYKEHESTHGQQFWAIPELGIKRSDGTECEAVLWDLAGQHVYRQIHSIFLENIAAALVLFDPSNRQDPLKGAKFWLEQLKGKGQLPPTVLVGARIDRGAPTIPQDELDQFCQRYGILGGYISTSAKSDEGIAGLLEKLKTQIPWDEMTATVTNVTFKRIKEYVLALKEKTDRPSVLVSPTELREQLEVSDSEWTFSDTEMMTAVGHLETHGYVTVLHNSAGEQYILLTPDLLVTLASSIVLLADKHPRELGAVNETELLQGKYLFDELKGLSKNEIQILLDAAVLRFLQHSICFRETLSQETLLIFPALIKQKRPLKDDLPAHDDISYIVRGRVGNLYASLVVLLGYTPTFKRVNQWQNQAQYEIEETEICGFRSIEEREGEIELVLYYGENIPVGGRLQFQELFEQFLYKRDIEVTRFPPIVCDDGHQQKRATVVERVRSQKPFMFCDECGNKVNLPDFTRPKSLGLSASPWLQREEAATQLRRTYEIYLTKVKGYRRDFAIPRCYISHHPDQHDRAESLTQDLRDAGIYVAEQADDVQPSDFVIILDSPQYKDTFSTLALNPDIPLVEERFNGAKLISLALTGVCKTHKFDECTSSNLCDITHYPIGLFDLVLSLYVIPFDHAGFARLRQTLHEQWEQNLGEYTEKSEESMFKIFISYSHKDEEFKDELVTMLAGLQRRGIVDAWQDRRIEAGDEWYTSIHSAMDDCDLALLLVSPDYIASRFIQEEEQPKLLARRDEMKTRVIPITVRPCLWQSEPVLKDLQALPKDGKAIITFSKEDGKRDEVWTGIASVIEKFAKSRHS